jgi:hypothetical protein
VSTLDGESRETGQIAYEAFATSLAWRFKGTTLPLWRQLEPYEQEAFREAAHQVIQKGWTVSAAPPTGRHRWRR